MNIISRMQTLLPDSRQAMSYQVKTGGTGDYYLQFNEIVTAEDSLIALPQGLLTGQRPDLLTLRGGCYEIFFDSLNNIEAGTPFFKRRLRGKRSQALNIIIDYIINHHYIIYRPYCYTFLAFDDLLSRAYRLILQKLCRSLPHRIAAVHLNLNPHRRGYAVKFK
ncbi:hypothetical protein [Kalamiella sp. sgz302252]|uniref:hypothetical protein n=1 Tax=Pantoea sp. sgz302252 TaxID=3341827 RepID=UPI0036D242BC